MKRKLNVSLYVQIDILIQCFANIISLNIPAFIIGLNPEKSFHWFEAVLMGFWFISLYLENKADMTKKNWIVKASPEDR